MPEFCCCRRKPGVDARHFWILVALAILSLSPADAHAEESQSTADCPAAPFDTPELRPFVTAMIEPGAGFDGQDLVRQMSPETLGKLAAMQRANEEHQKRDWPSLCRYSRENEQVLASGVRPEVVFLGDSITENWKIADPSLFGEKVLDRGISGQTTPQILLRFYQDVAALRPRVVHIMAGTNDIGRSPDDVTLNNIQAMIDMAKANGIAVVLAAIPPVKAFPRRAVAEPATRIAGLNRELQQIARKRGVVFADYHALLADNDGGLDPALGNDGVHPNRNGYAVMRPLTEQAIAEAIR